MSLPLVVANAAQVRLLWVVNTELVVNVLNCRISAGTVVGGPLADQVRAVANTSFTSHLQTHYGGNASLQGVGLRDLRTPNQPEYRGAGVSVAGTSVADTLPGTVAEAITLRTAKAGRSYRGRVYLSGWGEGENDAFGNQVAAAASAGLGFVTDLKNNWAPLGLTLGVLSRPTEAYQIVKTIHHADGTTTVKTLSNVIAKTGEINDVTIVESRTSRWEAQRRRDNGRGINGAALVLRAQQMIEQQLAALQV